MSGEASPFLPYGRQSIEEDDISAVLEVLGGDWLTSGPKVSEFERALCEAVGVKNTVACSSGTAALHLAAMALGLGQGDAVVVPAVTFLATANAARFAGAEVIFADVDSETGLMRADGLREAFGRTEGSSVKAVFPVHLAGQSAGMEEISGVARELGLKIVEDGCHALGTTGMTERGENISVGDCFYSDMTAFSFHPVKTIAMGEGGAVTTNDQTLASRLGHLRNHGIIHSAEEFQNTDLAFDADGSVNPWYYEMHTLGYNYRVTDIQCALGINQLKKLGRFVERRRLLADRYDQLISPLAPLVRPLARVSDCKPAWHLYVVLIDFENAGVSRRKVMSCLRKEGIGTQVHYIPVPHQPYYRERYGVQHLPGAEAYYARALSLPLFPGMAEADVDRVVMALQAALGVASESARG